MRHRITNEGPHEIAVTHMLGNDEIGWHPEGHIVKPGESFTGDIRSIHHGKRRAQYRVEPATE